MTYRMLDLCSGLGGASAAMRERGWAVLAVDILEWLKPDIVADIQHLPIEPYPVDLFWASVPCTEYSRNDQPWFPRVTPDLTLYQVCRDLIEAWQPRYYVLENVRGAQRFWGKAQTHYLSRYLWTDIPLLSPIVGLNPRSKRAVWGGDPLAYWKRSRIPYAISAVVAAAVESFGVSN